MNKMLVQFRVYGKVAKLVLGIVLLILFFNVVLGNIIGHFDKSQSYSNPPVNTTFLLVFSLAVVVAIMLPISFSQLFSYFLGFGMTRRRYFINTVISNIGISVVLSVVTTFMYFSQSILHTTKIKPMYYMGLNSLDFSPVTFLVSVMMYLGFFATVASLMFLVSFVFYKMGPIYGFSVILLVLSILLFFLKDIVEFVVWGQNPLIVGIGLVVAALGINMLTWPIVSRTEIKN